MLAYLQGEIMRKGENYLVVANQGVGYKVFVALKIGLEEKVGNQIELQLYEQVREDAQDLYGFKELSELALFEKLISVSGVGCKTALNIFSSANVSEIKSAIVNEDAGVLKKFSGIGAKTAERIILELKNKLDGVVGVNMKSKEELTDDSDVLEALTSLGYSLNQAREALSQVPKTVTDITAKVREALKLLGKK